MPCAEVNGLRIEYDVTGDGAPVLLVMGLGSQMILWHDEFVELLVERGFRVIRFDNRDIGASTHLDDVPAPRFGRTVAGMLRGRWARASYLLSDMAADAVGLLDHLGAREAHVVGASMGGMIAQTVAVEHPDRVASLTSIMSNTGDRRNGLVRLGLLRVMGARMRKPPADRVEGSVEVFRLISGPHFDEEQARLLAKRSVERGDDIAGAARQLAAILASPDRTEGLGAVEAPTLVIHGMVDPLVLPSGGKATAMAVPNAQLLMFGDMGHDLPRTRWVDIADAIAANSRRRVAPVLAGS